MSHEVDLDAFVGEWSMEAAFPFAPPTGIRGHTVFEWMPGPGTFSDDGQTIDGRWEISSDGSGWKDDFNLTYTKVK